MYSLDDSLDDSFDELDLEVPPTPGGGGLPPVAFDPTSAAIQAGIQVAKFIPGIKEIVSAPGELVGRIFGFGRGAKAKLRRLKKKGTRIAGMNWGQRDCLQNAGWMKCKGATGLLQEGNCYFRGKPPNEEFMQAYRVRYLPCVNALRDCRRGKKYGTNLWLNFPGNDPWVARRPHYKPTWEDVYRAVYQPCKKSEVWGSKSKTEEGFSISPWIIVGIVSLTVFALRGRAR